MKPKVLLVHCNNFIGGSYTVFENLKLSLSDHFDLDIVALSLSTRKKIEWPVLDPKKFIEYAQNYTHIIFNSMPEFAINEINPKFEMVYKTLTQNVYIYEHGADIRKSKLDLVAKLVPGKVIFLCNLLEQVNLIKSIGFDVIQIGQFYHPNLLKDIKTNEDSNILVFNSRATCQACLHKLYNDVEKGRVKFDKFILRLMLKPRDKGGYIWEMREDKILIEPRLNTVKHEVVKKSNNKFDMFNNAAACLYLGKTINEVAGTIECAIIEAAFLNLPLIIHPLWYNNYKKYNRKEDYGISIEEIRDQTTIFEKDFEKNINKNYTQLYKKLTDMYGLHRVNKLIEDIKSN